jgi:hypothetical protein
VIVHRKIWLFWHANTFAASFCPFFLSPFIRFWGNRRNLGPKGPCLLNLPVGGPCGHKAYHFSPPPHQPQSFPHFTSFLKVVACNNFFQLSASPPRSAEKYARFQLSFWKCTLHVSPRACRFRNTHCCIFLQIVVRLMVWFGFLWPDSVVYRTLSLTQGQSAIFLSFSRW